MYRQAITRRVGVHGAIDAETILEIGGTTLANFPNFNFELRTGADCAPEVSV
jgi:hypothetical protein